MSILEKISKWWTARQDAKREWLLEPLRFLRQAQQEYFTLADNARLADQGKLENALAAIEVTLKYRFGSLDLKANNLDNRLDAIVAENQSRHAHYCDQLNAIKMELDGIRSRYKWLEERYEDATKGNAPRTFDLEHRQ